MQTLTIHAKITKLSIHLLTIHTVRAPVIQAEKIVTIHTVHPLAILIVHILTIPTMRKSTLPL